MPGSIGNDLWALFSGERQGLGARRELSGWFSQALGRSYPGLSRAAVHASDGCLCAATLGRGVEACKASSLSRAAAERPGGSAVLPTLRGERGKKNPLQKELFGAANPPRLRALIRAAISPGASKVLQPFSHGCFSIILFNSL